MMDVIGVIFHNIAFKLSKDIKLFSCVKNKVQFFQFSIC